VGLIDYPINYFKNYHDPTALNMRFVAPNREKPLFNDARRFRFVDGGAFDFGGQNSKTFGDKSRTLAQSNQRSWKGFVPTFSFKRNYFHLVGSYKLDWFLVKPAVAVRDLPEMQPPFTPYQGRTLKDVNTALDYRISDHCPIVVDLPLATSAVVSIASRP
jgi:hypothetical protein